MYCLLKSRAFSKLKTKLKRTLPSILSPFTEWCKGIGNGGYIHSIMLHLCFSFMVTLLLLQCGVPSTGCHPSSTNPTCASHRLQFFKHCSYTSPYHGAHSSKQTTQVQVPTDSSSLSPPAPSRAPPTQALLLWGSLWTIPPSGLIHCYA